ncbi:hypothetical protein [Hymenobacter lapidiphilus]|uniref:hypothetical protein n=1 Tax=Hymenobacter sp. CCM 8763 TaxID=2303334 RepID=UPI0011C122EC|nr:hypothetical protein [Hymenobacter sp. CCM 8763]
MPLPAFSFLRWLGGLLLTATVLLVLAAGWWYWPRTVPAPPPTPATRPDPATHRPTGRRWPAAGRQLGGHRFGLHAPTWPP